MITCAGTFHCVNHGVDNGNWCVGSAVLILANARRYHYGEVWIDTICPIRLIIDLHGISPRITGRSSSVRLIGQRIQESAIKPIECAASKTACGIFCEVDPLLQLTRKSSLVVTSPRLVHVWVCIRTRMKPRVMDGGHLCTLKSLRSICSVDNGTIVIVVRGYRSACWSMIRIVRQSDRNAMIEEKTAIQLCPLMKIGYARAKAAGRIDVSMSPADRVHKKAEGDIQRAGCRQVKVQHLQYNIHGANGGAIIAYGDCTCITSGSLAGGNMNLNPNDQIIVCRQRKRECVASYTRGISLSPRPSIVKHSWPVLLCWNKRIGYA